MSFALSIPIVYNDPSGHDVGCAGQDASACGASPNNSSNNPWASSNYSTWQLILLGSKCLACHVTHDGSMDDGRIPDNSQIDAGLANYYRSLDPVAGFVHSFALSMAGGLGTVAVTAPSDEFELAYTQGQRVTGDFPTNSNSEYLFRDSSPNGTNAGFAKYDPNSTQVQYRVDLQGPTDNNVPTPHVHNGQWNTNPNSGQTFFNGWSPANPFEIFSDIFHSIFR